MKEMLKLPPPRYNKEEHHQFMKLMDEANEKPFNIKKIDNVDGTFSYIMVD